MAPGDILPSGQSAWEPDPDPEELLEAYRDYEEVLPEGVIPLADDGGDNLFCIEVAGEDRGAVYFHNHSIGWHVDADKLIERGEPVPANIRYQTVYRLASSFTEFILGMTRGQPD